MQGKDCFGKQHLDSSLRLQIVLNTRAWRCQVELSDAARIQFEDLLIMVMRLPILEKANFLG